VVVAQGVEDEFQLPARGGHDRDVAPASFSDPIAKTS
jgi:hypothetical protein